MRPLHQLCLDVLRPPAGFALHATELVAPTADAIRARAPNAITRAETLDFKTLTPEPGGLFDFKLFGGGTVIDAPPVVADAPYTPRRTRFARLTLAEPIVHPLALAHAPDEVAERAGWTRDELDRWRVAESPEDRGALVAALVRAGQDRGLVLVELPVLPAEFRPLTRLDDDRWQSSALNDHYRRAISMNVRWAKLIAQNAPAAHIAIELRHLVSAILALFENEDRARPATDSKDQPLASLRATCGGTDEMFAAIGELDRLGGVTTGALGRVHRVAATLFAFGFELQPLAA